MIRAASDNCREVLGVEVQAALGSALAGLVGIEPAGRLIDAEDGDVVSMRFPAGLCDAVVHHGLPFDLIEVEPEPGTFVDDQARLQRALLRFHGATDSAALVAQAAAIVQDLTGFDRVMVYRFDAEWNGEVVAEVARPGLEPFLGLRYPASDIPPQARATYSRMRVRVIPDVNATPSPVLANGEGSASALDLSDVAIRAVSPVHLQYLTNMGVRASMSVAIHVAGRLWGLIACHHLTEPLRPPVRTRNAVDLVGRTTSTVLAALLASESAAIRVDLLERLDALTEPMRLDGELDPGEALAAAGDQLPALLDAGGAAVVAGGTAMLAGTCPPVDLVHEVTSHATAADLDLLESDQLSLIDERWAAHADTAAGALAVRVGSGDQWLIWFRPETATEIRWGGDPNKTDAVLGLRGQSQLNPRASFAEYLEHVHGTSAPWSGEQVSAARQAAARLAALNAARLQRDAGIAAALQRAVLIEAFPPTPGVDGAARYLPSGRDPIGGDWYDVFFRHEGGPVVAVGDVAGHGLSVAPAMAQLRHALRAYVIREDSPAEAMARLNHLMRTLLPRQMATAMIISLDADRRTVDIVNAGHLPPVVISPEGARLIEDSHHDSALGATRGASYTSTRLHLPPGHTLVLYTDGLIERRTAHIDDRLAVLLDAAADGGELTTIDLCDHLVADVADGSDVDDDITVLALRFTGP